MPSGFEASKTSSPSKPTTFMIVSASSRIVTSSPVPTLYSLSPTPCSMRNTQAGHVVDVQEFAPRAAPWSSTDRGMRSSVDVFPEIARLKDGELPLKAT